MFFKCTVMAAEQQNNYYNVFTLKSYPWILHVIIVFNLFCSSLFLYVFIVYLYFVFFTFVLPHMA